METPYFEIGEDIYDLEIELFNTKDGFVKLKRKVHAILNGKRLTDKYGNIIHLQSKEEKQEFKEKLEQDMTLNLFVQNKFKKT